MNDDRKNAAPATPQWGIEFPRMHATQEGNLGIQLPAGWEDVSWHNDACPQFYNEKHKLALFVSEADPDEREITGDRFLLCRTDAHGYADGEVLLTTESASDMLAKITSITPTDA